MVQMNVQAQGQGIAPLGGGGIGDNPLAPFFGQPLTAAQMINPSERLPHTAINFSDAQDFTDLYKGPSPFMAITLEKMIVGEDEWPTRKLMPWVHTDKVNVAWQIWRYDSEPCIG